ncbi:MAG: amidohydrolase family protein, partial [Acidimicrobiia bacterium]
MRHAIAATTLVTPVGPGPLAGPGLVAPLLIADGATAWEDETIVYVGPAAGLQDVEPEWFEGCTIAPGFVDCHTHLPFVGWRADEFEARLAGATYRDLHGGGGIYRSARLFARASDDDVLAFCRPLLAEMLAHGTTALELKTGYGLSVEGELRQARLARRLAAEAVQTCTVTLLACHAVPEGVDRADWVRTVCEELIPAAAAEGLADAVDIYVEDIAFSLEDLHAVAGAAHSAGLPLRCHADQLGPSGAAEAAVALGARSADHLNHVSLRGMAALGDGNTAAVLLPTSTLFLRAAPPDVRALLDAGAVVAIATDFNPGTSPVLSMPEVIA